MKKTMYFLAVFVSIVTFYGCASNAKAATNANDITVSQNLDERHFETNGAYSICPPKSWQLMEIGLKYPAIMGETKNSFTPNINFVNETVSGVSATDYIDAVIPMLETVMAEVELIHRASFTTNSNIRGECIIIQARLNEIKVRQTMYAFLNDSKQVIYTITCSAPLDGGEVYDAIFEESIKTFDWIQD
ncbi:hypothetical protein AGMMS50268_14480 [Spirochaetia bacterium]|nr:hypothetical protein AGMMS50276_27930 [Synergistales bacterium]GHV90945.1 hypothetical protein AGMMS50268_14480 [Spirochaetia bacterium]